MEKKTNKEKLANFQNFWENQFYRKAIAFDEIGGNYVLSANSMKICLLGYFCNAEFISAMKTVPNPTIFVKNAKK